MGVMGWMGVMGDGWRFWWVWRGWCRLHRYRSFDQCHGFSCNAAVNPHNQKSLEGHLLFQLQFSVTALSPFFCSLVSLPPDKDVSSNFLSQSSSAVPTVELRPGWKLSKGLYIRVWGFILTSSRYVRQVRAAPIMRTRGWMIWYVSPYLRREGGRRTSLGID